ncbi:hypothetical protein MHBO_003910, partial [Bonamia ostreae]
MTEKDAKTDFQKEKILQTGANSDLAENKPGNRQKKKRKMRHRMDQNELINKLFEAFDNKSHYKLNELVLLTDQPLVSKLILELFEGDFAEDLL